MFETLDDADVRTAGTTYLMYRGRYRHEPQRDTALTRIASTLMRHPVMGPRELFYADIFASRRTGCRSGLGMPGVRDRHSGCVSSYLVEHDLFDFLLLSLPDNDWYSHKYGPDAQVQSIAQADLQLARVFQAAGGVDEFLSEHAVIAMADHSQTPITATIALQDELAELGVRGPSRSSEKAAWGRAPHRRLPLPARRDGVRPARVRARRDARLGRRRARSRSRASSTSCGWRATRTTLPARGSSRAQRTASCASARAVRSRIRAPRPGASKGRWRSSTRPSSDGRLHTPSYPDALARVWSALTCPTSGEVLLSAAPGYEFIDWGRQAHLGGGSHGSLHASDSLGALVLCGVTPAPGKPAQWAIRDVAHARAVALRLSA